MRRREFITLLGGAAAWPLEARAQQSPMPAVGIISVLTPGSSQHLSDAFRRGLGESGYVEGQNITIEYRFAAGRYDRFQEMAADLVQRRVSVIAAFGSAAAVAAKAATQTLPILFAATEDPVSLACHGPDVIDQYQRAASYIDRIFKGEKPADLPVQAPTKYELVVNLKTAKALGLDIPTSILARADEVIE